MIAALLFLAQGVVAPAPFEEPVVPDPVLAEHRGGVRLPNGVDLALSVQTQTAVDGAIVLQTVFAIDEGPARTTIYTPADGRTVPAPRATSSGQVTAAAMPTVTFDSRNGIQFTPGASGPRASISSAAAGAEAAIPDGLQRVDGPSGVLTANGTVSEASGGNLRSVILSGRDLEIVHFAGSAFGSAIVNAGSNREISTDTSISIDLRNAGPDVIGSSMLRVEDVALGALGSRL